MIKNCFSQKSIFCLRKGGNTIQINVQQRVYDVRFVEKSFLLLQARSLGKDVLLYVFNLMLT